MFQRCKGQNKDRFLSCPRAVETRSFIAWVTIGNLFTWIAGATETWGHPSQGGHPQQFRGSVFEEAGINLKRNKMKREFSRSHLQGLAYFFDLGQLVFALLVCSLQLQTEYRSQDIITQ